VLDTTAITARSVRSSCRTFSSGAHPSRHSYARWPRKAHCC